VLVLLVLVVLLRLHHSLEGGEQEPLDIGFCNMFAIQVSKSLSLHNAWPEFNQFCS